MTKVEILCQGSTLDVDLETLQQSPTLECIRRHSSDPLRIEIPNIPFGILRKSLEFCEHYRHSSPKVIPRPLVSLDLIECGVDTWDATFIELDSFEDLADLTASASFLEIPGLLLLCCAKLAVIKQAARLPAPHDSAGPASAGQPFFSHASGS